MPVIGITIQPKIIMIRLWFFESSIPSPTSLYFLQIFATTTITVTFFAHSIQEKLSHHKNLNWEIQSQNKSNFRNLITTWSPIMNKATLGLRETLAPFQFKNKIGFNCKYIWPLTKIYGFQLSSVHKNSCLRQWHLPTHHFFTHHQGQLLLKIK